MAFQIRPLKEFLVRPALPPTLNRLSEVAYNVQWSWDHTIRSLFKRIDPALWKACDHNPVLVLGRVPQATLERSAQHLASLVSDGVPLEKLFPLRQELPPRRTPAPDLAKTGTGHDG